MSCFDLFSFTYNCSVDVHFICGGCMKHFDLLTYFHKNISKLFKKWRKWFCNWPLARWSDIYFRNVQLVFPIIIICWRCHYLHIRPFPIVKRWCWFSTLVHLPQVKYQGDSGAALISFSTTAEANAAYRSPEPVFNNRFIKLFWHTQVLAAFWHYLSISIMMSWC